MFESPPWVAQVRPDFTTETGVKLWKNESLSSWARKKKVSILGWYYMDSAGDKGYLLTENGIPIGEYKDFESACCRIDIAALDRTISDTGKEAEPHG